jgi:hypothetical protein
MRLDLAQEERAILGATELGRIHAVVEIVFASGPCHRAITLSQKAPDGSVERVGFRVEPTIVGCALQAVRRRPLRLPDVARGPPAAIRRLEEVDMQNQSAPIRYTHETRCPMRTVLLVFMFGGLAAGCSAAGGDYQSALPTRATLAINVPGAGASTSGESQQALLGAQADFYTLTVQVSKQLNGAADGFFGMIDTALASPPSAQDASHAVWGPFTPALSPVTVELAVERSDAQDYDFFLGGKPKGAPDSAYVGLMGGSAHTVDAAHGSGTLQVNFSTMNTLDPTTNPSTGAIAFQHDNTADPRTVDVHFGDFVAQPGATPMNATYHYAEHPDTSGTFQFALRADFDHDPAGALEDVTVMSRWTASGAGRADLIASGGSLPAGFVVHATECWDERFARVFYTEDVDPSKSEGEASACAIP